MAKKKSTKPKKNTQKRVSGQLVIIYASEQCWEVGVGGVKELLQRSHVDSGIYGKTPLWVDDGVLVLFDDATRMVLDPTKITGKRFVN